MTSSQGSSPAGGEPVHNRDIAPRAGPSSSEIAALSDNAEIRQAFDCYETEANRLKKLYERLGRISVLSIGTSAVYAAYRNLSGDPSFVVLDAVAVVLGAAGIGLDLWIRFRNLKLRWLANRFGAERVRSAKFQLYALAAFVHSKEELEESVREMTRAMVSQIEQELCFPIGALNTFHGPAALHLTPPARLPAAGSRRDRTILPLLRAAIDDYRERRVRYQYVFAEQMSRDIADQQRGYASLSDALYVLGAILLVAGVALRGSDDLTLAIPVLEATGLALFVLTATANILSLGAGHMASNSRYQQYSRDLSRLLDVEPRTPQEFVKLIERMELLALRELDDFWRDMWISSYRS